MNINMESIIKVQQLLSYHLHSTNTEKWEYNGSAHQLFIDFRNAYVSFMTEVLHKISTEFRIPKKLLGQLKNLCMRHLEKFI